MKAVSIAVVLFFVALGVVVGLRMDTSTITLLGGTVIGILIAVPCAVIATYATMQKQDEQSRSAPSIPDDVPRYWTPPPQQTLPAAPPTTSVTNYNYYDQRKVVVVAPSTGRAMAKNQIDAAK